MRRAWVWLTALLPLLLPGRSQGQDLEPRAYSASPVGMNFVVAGITRSSGSVLFDPTLPFSDVRATLHIPTFGLGHTFAFFGRQGLVTVGLPYAWGRISGKVDEQSASITRSGLADTRVKFAVNLRGNPARSPAEFAKKRKRTYIIGTSLTVSAPASQYSGKKLINLGTNRWGFKPELGISFPIKKRFDLEAYCGVWVFTHNDNFFPGGRLRAQDPVTALQVHASYTFRPRLWIAADFTWYQGGSATVGNGPPSTPQKNSRAGVTFSFPVGKQQSVKIAYSDGTTVRFGTNFNTIGIAWQFAWFGHPGARSR